MGIPINRPRIAPKARDLKEYMRGNIPRSDYLTHNIHQYTAKLVPRIPRYLIGEYTRDAYVVFDPFCGSGTSLLEAKLLNRNAIGFDINPLATLISRVKTTPLDIEAAGEAIDSVKRKLRESCNATVDFPNIDYWFSSEAKSELARIKLAVESLKHETDEDTYRFMQVCFSSIVRRSSYADPRIAKTYKSKRVIEKLRTGWAPTPILYFHSALDRNFEKIRALSQQLSGNERYVKVFNLDARKASFSLKQKGIEVDSIVTSPPYINAQDYFRSYKLELWWLGLLTPKELDCLDRKTVGTEHISGFDYEKKPNSENELLDLTANRIWRRKNKESRKKSYIVINYFTTMKSIFSELYNALRSGGFFCLITGNNTICEVRVPTYTILSQIAEAVDFRLVKIYRDKIRNRSLFPKRNHPCGTIKEEWIAIFQK
jgi:DNA modification methylase